MIALVVLVAAICRALNRNQRRQIRPTLNGIEDRDLQRLVKDLRALT
ncbi:hypothetical protein [Kribbella jiaozuonensis]|nr:hypothetical protein [Kribbella jiaozuonensis]